MYDVDVFVKDVDAFVYDADACMLVGRMWMYVCKT